jgi:hypothetical protein
VSTTTTTSEDLKKVEPACPVPCKFCPWRLANQGSKPDPHRFYTPANLARLWKGLRSGARMSCHPTDPRMAEFAGYEALADRESTNECSGALVIVQREFMVFQDLAHANPESKKVLQLYRKQRPNGMTREGLIALAERAMLGGTILNPIAMSKPNLADAEIGYPAVDRKPK